MKASFGLTALAAAALTLAGCASVAGTGDDDGRPVVATTFTVIADVADNVAGGHLQVESIIKPGAEIHEYEPTPSDIAKASDADLILDHGMGLERWFKKFVARLDVPHVVVSDGVDPIDITGDEYAGMPNPHTWMSPRNVAIYVDNMAEAFGELDPEHASDFEANAQQYKVKLETLHDDLHARLDELPDNQRALVTCEGAFPYLARAADLTEKYIWPVNAESQATPQQITSTIEFVEDNDVPAVFCESTVSDKPMRSVVSATDARFGGTLYVDSLSQADGPVPTYLDLMRYNADLIVSGLTGTDADRTDTKREDG